MQRCTKGCQQLKKTNFFIWLVAQKSRGEQKDGSGNEMVMWTYNNAVQIAEKNTEKSRNNIYKWKLWAKRTRTHCTRQYCGWRQTFVLSRWVVNHRTIPQRDAHSVCQGLVQFYHRLARQVQWAAVVGFSRWEHTRWPNLGENWWRSWWWQFWAMSPDCTCQIAKLKRQYFHDN